MAQENLQENPARRSLEEFRSGYKSETIADIGDHGTLNNVKKKQKH